MLTNFRVVFGTTGIVQLDMALTVVFTLSILMMVFRVIHDLLNK